MALQPSTNRRKALISSLGRGDRFIVEVIGLMTLAAYCDTVSTCLPFSLTETLQKSCDRPWPRRLEELPVPCRFGVLRTDKLLRSSASRGLMQSRLVYHIKEQFLTARKALKLLIPYELEIRASPSLLAVLSDEAGGTLMRPAGDNKGSYLVRG